MRPISLFFRSCLPMQSLLRPSHSLGGIWLSAILFIGSVSLLAQGNSPQAPGLNNSAEKSPVIVPPSAASAPSDLVKVRTEKVRTISEHLSEAKTQVKNGDTVGAARTLALANLCEADTAAWHIETTQRLMQVAGHLSREGNARDAKTVVTESLRQLEQAASLAKTGRDSAAEARAHLAAGAIHDRFRGDPVAAIASYEAALRANPSDAGAKEALERLQKSYANLLARGKKAKK